MMHFEASDPQFSPVKPLFLKGKRLLLLLALRLGKRKSARNMRPNIVNFNFGVFTVGELIYPPIDLHLIFEKSILSFHHSLTSKQCDIRSMKPPEIS